MASIKVSAQAILDEALPIGIAGYCAEELASVSSIEVHVDHANLSDRVVRMEPAARQRHEAGHKKLVEIKAVLGNERMTPASQQASPRGGAVGPRSAQGPWVPGPAVPGGSAGTDDDFAVLIASPYEVHGDHNDSGCTGTSMASFPATSQRLRVARTSSLAGASTCIKRGFMELHKHQHSWRRFCLAPLLTPSD